MTIRHRSITLLFSGLALLPAWPSLAQTFPAKSVRIIVPYSPGGTTDLLARIVGQKLSQAWGVPVVVDNRPGANGIVGTEIVAKAPPDGHTLSIATVGTHAANASIYPALSYDTIKDFAPVTLAVNAPMLLVAHPTLPVKNVKELIALAKAKPDQITYASGGSGSSQHLAMELLKLMTGMKIVHIPYKGSAASYIDLLAGNVLLEIDVLPTSLPHVKGGKLRALGTGAAQRLPQLPEVPTIAEAGVPGYESNAWYGFVTTGGTPKEVVAKLNADIIKAMNAPDSKERLSGAGVIIVGNSPERFAAFIKTEMDKAAKVVKAANIKAD